MSTRSRYSFRSFVSARTFLALIAVLCGLTQTASYAQGLPGSGIGVLSQPQFLPVDQAFAYYTSAPEPGIIAVNWEIAPGYYLYKEKFGFAFAGNAGTTTLAATLPSSTSHHDEFFGDVEVYYDLVAAHLDIPPEHLSGQLTLIIEYQGCAEEGLCYPPQRREITLEF